MDRPPCWHDGQPCPNACAAQQYRRQVYNETPLYGPWSGWRLVGQRLVAPSKEWIAPHQLDRELFRRGRFLRY